MIASHKHVLTVEKSHEGESWAWPYIKAWQGMGYAVTRDDVAGTIIITAEITFHIGEGPVED